MKKTAQKTPAHRYTLLVEWSDEDSCFIGRCPELMLGGVHGDDRAKVFAELEQVVSEVIGDAKKRGEALPAPLAGKKFSGKFILRTGTELHRQLALNALKAGDSLNNYVVKKLQTAA